MSDPDAVARRRLADRRAVVDGKLAELERRLAVVRRERGEWTDEEHDPEGFALTFEWQHAEGSRAEYQEELGALDRAGRRIDAGTYGICAVCTRPIPAAQLELRPARMACVRCTDDA